jgi:uncharacterized protein (DUF1800 family)
MEAQRLEISRLYARFAFGPRPGQFAQALAAGFATSAKSLLNTSLSDPALDALPLPSVPDLGSRPSPGDTAATKAFNLSVRTQTEELTLWWLDRMAIAQNPLIERMTWFWHGHWATSIDKVNFALPMFNQNQTLRTNSLGNFRTMAHAMFHDGALQIWLDGNDSVKNSPNENLSREFMELFAMGVNNYTEDDVKAVARAFTGYQVGRTTGVVTFNPKRHDSNPIKLFGSNTLLDGDSATDLIVSCDENARFITERLWFRFISSSQSVDTKFGVQTAFANRDIASAVKALVSNGALSVPQYGVVRQPVEWFIAICRAFAIQPSKLSPRNFALGHLLKMSQVPFLPPNVGGWPTDEAWLSSASAQFRISFAAALSKQIDFSALAAVPAEKRIDYIKDLLGIYNFSTRTFIALTNAKDDLPQFFTLAVCSPEFVVNE